MLGKTRRVHFIGIGGIGMSGIAELLANLGYAVSGSDEKRSAVTDRLATLGIRVASATRPRMSATRMSWWCRRRCGRRTRKSSRQPAADSGDSAGRNARGADAAALRDRGRRRARQDDDDVDDCVVLERAGLDPTAVIGGRFSAFGSNARLGRGELMVAEADESDRSFLKLFPTIAVITNIDQEHLESYGSFADLQQAFVDFANKVPFYGASCARPTIRPLRAVLPRMTRRVITYGLDSPPPNLRRDRRRARVRSVCSATVVQRTGGGAATGRRSDR